jgi:hypothetical protein
MLMFDIDIIYGKVEKKWLISAERIMLECIDYDINNGRWVDAFH